jgi:hypothetical protein
VRLYLNNLELDKDVDLEMPQFNVGDTVTVAVRTLRTGPNPENGPAVITHRIFNDSMKWVYNVQFVDRNGKKENDCPSSILTFLDVHGDMKTSKRGNGCC